MEDITLRYSSHLNTIDWEDLLNKELPLTSHHRKNILLHLSGQYSINPLLLLSKIVIDQTDVYGYAIKSDEEFRTSLKAFANDLSRYDQDFDSQNIKAETSSLEYSLQKVLSDDDELTDDFLTVCKALRDRNDISTITASTKQHQRIFKRTEEEKIGLKLPYGQSECWQFG